MKRQTKGFTLVELLVVMAIISILAAIAVPNAIKYIAKGRATKAIGDITAIDGALVKVLADTGRANLNQLFNPDAIHAAIGFNPLAGLPFSTEQFNAATAIYTGALLGILRDGRGAAVLDDVIPNTNAKYKDVLNQTVCKKLSSTYLEIGFDPWGNLYNIFPGPWQTATNLPVPFRKRFPESDANANGVKLPGKGDRPDNLTVTIQDPDDPNNPSAQLQVGFPASKDRAAFVWSNGANLVSGQAIYMPGGYGSLTTDQKYNIAENQEENLAVAGDDINNWDKGQSWSSFY